MAHDPQSMAHVADSGRMAARPVAPARGWRRAPRPVALLPEIGADDVILPTFEKTLGSFAMRAQLGDRIARDALFHAYRPKLDRLARRIRPPYAPEGTEGIWNREDVAQEAYLVFVDLVGAWAGDVDFTAFLLSRFPWRLKDTVFRGIGKPPVPPRWRRVPVDDESLHELVAVQEGADALFRVLEGLPEPLPAILVAHAIDGRTQAAIARDLGVSRRTVARYWARIRQHAADVLVNGDS